MWFWSQTLGRPKFALQKENFEIQKVSQIELKNLRFDKKFLFGRLFFVNSHADGTDSWVQTAVKSILLDTLFLDQLHNFSLLFC